jgi:hypothetical protein
LRKKIAAFQKLLKREQSSFHLCSEVAPGSKPAALRNVRRVRLDPTGVSRHLIHRKGSLF